MIINSLLDNDIYKYMMMQSVFHQFPKVKVEYCLFHRNNNSNLYPYFKEINSEIDKLSKLKFTLSEIKFLDNLPIFKKDFIKFLKNFRIKKKFNTYKS